MRRCILNLIRKVATEMPSTFSKTKHSIENQPIMHKRMKLNIESLNTEYTEKTALKLKTEWWMTFSNLTIEQTIKKKSTAFIYIWTPEWPFHFSQHFLWTSEYINAQDLPYAFVKKKIMLKIKRKKKTSKKAREMKTNQNLNRKKPHGTQEKEN